MFLDSFLKLVLLKNVVMMQFHKQTDLNTCLNFVLRTNQSYIDHLFSRLSYLTYISMQPHAHLVGFAELCVNGCHFLCLICSSVPSGEARLSGSSDHESAHEETAGASVQCAAQHQHLGDGSDTSLFPVTIL